MSSPMPVCTEMIGAAIRPARPANTAPRPNTRLNSSSMLTPSAATMRRFEAPARISMPSRVRATSQASSSATSAPTTMIAKR